MEPVKKSEAPDYYEVIRFPIGEGACIHFPACAPKLLPSVLSQVPTMVGSPSYIPSPLRVMCLLPCHPDLKTMTERLRSRYYVTRKLFVADLQRVIANCREYNPPDSEYCRCASALEKFFYFKLKEGGLIDK